MFTKKCPCFVANANGNTRISYCSQYLPSCCKHFCGANLSQLIPTDCCENILEAITMMQLGKSQGLINQIIIILSVNLTLERTNVTKLTNESVVVRRVIFYLTLAFSVHGQFHGRGGVPPLGLTYA